MNRRGESSRLLRGKANPSPRGPQPLPAPKEVWAKDLARHSPNVDWIWKGFLVRGAVTLLTSQWKSGKTTLVSVLLSRLGAGGEFAGQPLTRAKVAVVSEEAAEHWRRRADRLNFGDGVCFFCRPFATKPTMNEWLSLLGRLGQLRREGAIDLAIIDPLAAFLPSHGEANADAALTALLPLTRLTEEGLCVLLLHHPRKGEPVAGQAARGSGALCGFADILIEMQFHGRAQREDRRRRLHCWSRHEETPKQLVIELTADGADYVSHGEDDDFSNGWSQIHELLGEPPRMLTRRQMLDEWPDKGPPPSAATLWRWMDRAVAGGLARSEGSGRKGDPFRYGLVGVKATWEPDMMDTLAAIEARGWEG